MAKNTFKKPAPAAKAETLADAARTLAKACQSNAAALEALRAKHEAEIDATKAPLFALISETAKRFPNVTLEAFKADFAPAFIEAYGDEKKARGNLIKLRNAFLGVSHGVAVPKGLQNVQKYADDVARPALIKAGVIEASPAGRKAGQPNQDKGGDDVLVALSREFKKADKNTRRDIIAGLAAFIEGDKSGKLLAAILNAEVAKHGWDA